MRWSWEREETVSITMSVLHNMIRSKVGKQKIARPNHLCWSYEYVCAIAELSV